MNVYHKWAEQPWHLHAVFAALFWGAVAGLILVWPVIMTVVPLWFAIVGAITLSAALALAKYLKRPGTE
jgi:hypothetical protein